MGKGTDGKSRSRAKPSGNASAQSMEMKDSTLGKEPDWASCRPPEAEVGVEKKQHPAAR
jgi:hypothetical protein